MAATPGRGFLSFTDHTEKGAFCAWFSTVVAENGGGDQVSSRTGVHKDTLTKYIYGRSIPSRNTLVKMIEAGIIGYESPEALGADAPWLADRFVEEAKSRKIAEPKKTKPKSKPAANREIVAAPEPELIGMSLMDAIMAEKGITAKQRAQLAGLTAMIVNGVEIDIQISPRSR